jgi:N,N-dimethylformamidase
MAFQQVLADELNIYAITGDGSLLWYRDTARDGTNGPTGERGWAPRSGSPVGTGWSPFTSVFGGGGGIIYAITEDGSLVWFRDLLRDGSNGPAGSGWAPRSGTAIGAGWGSFRHVFSGGDGIIYAVRPTGELLWYRDVARDGSNGPTGAAGWAAGSGNQIGSGWSSFTAVFATGGSDGIIYAVTPTSDLRFYRDTLRNGGNGPTGSQGWGSGSGSAIGVGWAIEPRAHLAGYATPLSVGPGETLSLKLSAQQATSCSVQILRLKENPDGTVGVPVGAPVRTVQVGHQDVPDRAWQNGCGWPTTLQLVVDPAWTSGLYTARVTAPGGGGTVDLVFVVRPGTARRRLLLIANTNCWNAYNAWGGASNYTGFAESVTLNFERPNPETAPSARTGSTYTSNHLTAAEIWVSTWLENAGYPVDTCSDFDFHRGIPGPSGYRAVILSTHPEYWSQQMALRLSDYVRAGGKVMYWGGNGIFRQVIFPTAEGRSMTTGSTSAWFCGKAWPDGPKPRALLGVAYELEHDTLYPARCGYVVNDAGHRFFAGTGLQAGNVIGTTGRNGGGACGWEVDTAIDFREGNGSAPVGERVLARGELASPLGYTGHMTYYENSAGGFVFAIGSITFGGSLPMDTRLQRMVRNALDAALA